MPYIDCDDHLPVHQYNEVSTGVILAGPAGAFIRSLPLEQQAAEISRVRGFILNPTAEQLPRPQPTGWPRGACGWTLFWYWLGY